MRIFSFISPALVLAVAAANLRAQDVVIPDPGLNAAIRDTLLKPTGPLTQQDMLSLTNLNANNRAVRSIAGLESARNLRALYLVSNQLTNLALPATLTNLVTLDASFNSLTNVALPTGLARLSGLFLDANHLRTITLPPDATALTSAHLRENLLTNVVFPAALTALADVDLSENELASLSLPSGATNLEELNLFFNLLPSLAVPAELPKLRKLDLDSNRLRTITLPPSLPNLIELRLHANLLTNIDLPAGMSSLSYLDLRENQLTQLRLPAGLSHLSSLGLSSNKLTSLTLPPGLTNLSFVIMRFNQLTNLTLPSDLSRLGTLDALANQLTSISLPPGLTALSNLFLSGNQLSTVTVPPDMTNLSSLVLNGNPLTMLVLPEALAATRLAETVAALQIQGVTAFTYPPVAQLFRIRQPAGAFQFALNGPPGHYNILASTNLADWSAIGAVSNPLGAIVFTDVAAHSSPRKFYRAQWQAPPANMVFIPPNTFTMGTPTNAANRAADEGPTTTVTLTRGYWIGKYEVTQREYLAVIGSNPSGFGGDLERPVETVSWHDATNYCVRRTQQELAAGQIAPGSHYRLPTEAEWECAARAGTSTQFSYGDDPNFTELANHAWYWFNSDVAPHTVGQKAPNSWGLYDMEGNVWEWTQDWYGQYPGGSITDPQGPASNSVGAKVIRGGAWDSGEANCRSGRRQKEDASVAEYILGFRVVLVSEP